MVMWFVGDREDAETENYVGERMSMALWWCLPVDLFVDLLPAVSPSSVLVPVLSMHRPLNDRPRAMIQLWDHGYILGRLFSLSSVVAPYLYDAPCMMPLADSDQATDAWKFILPLSNHGLFRVGE